MNNPILELKNVSFAYPDSPPALHELSVSIRQGERIAVLGSNGAGKSTFFLCCNGVNTPTGGSVFYRGAQVTKKRADMMALRSGVGIVFQDPNQQIIGSTVEAEVSFGPINLGLADTEVETRVADSLAAMNLTAMRERPPHHLSGGEKKRVSIADVLAMTPDILLFDEPTASLDIENIDMLESVLAQLSSQGKTLLVSTHDIDFAWRWATRALVFSQGRLIADATPAEIFADETLLQQARLRRPTLLDVVQLLREQNLLQQSEESPKSLAQLADLLKAHDERK